MKGGSRIFLAAKIKVGLPAEKRFAAIANSILRDGGSFPPASGRSLDFEPKNLVRSTFIRTGYNPGRRLARTPPVRRNGTATPRPYS
jgi:hypothetical protein